MFCCMNQLVLNQDSYTQHQIWFDATACYVEFLCVRFDFMAIQHAFPCFGAISLNLTQGVCCMRSWRDWIGLDWIGSGLDSEDMDLCPKQWNWVELLHKNPLSWNQTMQQSMDIPGSRKGWCSAAATAEPAPLKAELKLLPQQAPCYGKPETFAVLLRAQQLLKALETPQSDCLQSETLETLLNHDALLCSIMQRSLDTTVDACLKGILFPPDKTFS